MENPSGFLIFKIYYFMFFKWFLQNLLNRKQLNKQIKNVTKRKKGKTQLNQFLHYLMNLPQIFTQIKKFNTKFHLEIFSF